MAGDEHTADIYVSGLSHIELIGGGCARFVCYLNRFRQDGSIIRVFRPGIIMPLVEVPDAVRKSMLIPTEEKGTIRRLNPMWLQ
jgi:hypothetical protein